MKLIVDHIEGQTVICEDEQEQMQSLDLKQFPAAVTEGDIILLENDCITILAEETLKRRAEMKSRMNRLFKK